VDLQYFIVCKAKGAATDPTPDIHLPPVPSDPRRGRTLCSLRFVFSKQSSPVWLLYHQTFEVRNLAATHDLSGVNALEEEQLSGEGAYL
jgi:hypothetical protein